MDYILSPSILAADFSNLGEQIKITEQAGAKYLHFDVMDGMFVPSISFGMPVLASVKKLTGQVLDVHLMIKEPARYVKDFKEAGADILTVHLEACENVGETLENIRDYGMKCGISIRPGTPVSQLEPYLDVVDMVLIMSVEPGFGGQKFMPESLERIQELRQRLLAKGRDIDIEVDGGIYLSNVEEVLHAGANVIVAGSAIFKEDPADNTKEFMEILKRYEE